MALFKKGDVVQDLPLGDDFEIITVNDMTGTYSLKQLTGQLKGAIYNEQQSVIDRLCRIKSSAKALLKYKVGDQIRYNTGGEYEIIGYDTNVSNNKQTYILKELHYPVGGVANVMHEDCDFVDNNSNLLLQQYGGTNNQIAKLQSPRFKVGNIVTNTKGSTLMITFVGNNFYDFKYLKCSNNPSQVGKTSNETIEFADKNWKLDVTYRDYQIDNPKQTKECTCESRTIFLKGCQCGAVQKYKPKWS